MTINALVSLVFISPKPTRFRPVHTGLHALGWLLAWIAAPALSAQTTTAYTFSTLAGVAARTGSTDGTGGGANLPLFYRPTGLVLNSDGNLFVTDAGYGLIREVTPGGVVTTVAGTPGLSGGTDGTGTNSNVSFNAPRAPALDSAGNLYVADYLGATIRKITPAGVVTTLAGLSATTGLTDATGSEARFLNPSGLAVDASGNVFVADAGNSVIRKITSAGVVTTFAGIANTVGSADGTGTAASFNYPRGLAVDRAGNLYVGDCNSNTIRKITPAGVVTTLAGTAGTYGGADGVGAEARFNFPNGLAVDDSGNIYVADEINNTIRKITVDGTVTTLAGLAGASGRADGAGSAARFDRPTGVTVDGQGNVYVTDYNNQLIRKVTAAGEVTTLAGVGGAAGFLDGSGYLLNPSLFRNPTGIAVTTGNIAYVADTGNHSIRSITTAGVVTTLAGSTGNVGLADGTGSAATFNAPNSVAVGLSGNILVADTANHLIRVVTTGGTVTTLAGTGGTAGSADGQGTGASFNLPTGVAVDAAGNAYVADYGNHTIRKISPTGLVTTLAGSAGVAGSTNGAGTAASFNHPRALAVSADGTVYVSDSGNQLVRQITAAGFVTTLAGTAGVGGGGDGTGTGATFDGPAGLAVDAAGNVYLADTNNSTIRKISATGVVTTIGGTSGSVGSTDGVGGGAKFHHPAGLAVDPAGNLYLADTQNQTIRLGLAPGNTIPGSGSGGGSTDGGSGGSGSGGDGSSDGGSGGGSSGGGSGTDTGGPSTPAGSGFLLNPSGVAADSSGNYYVTDTANNCIKMIAAADATVTVFAGKSGAAGSTDGTGTAALFNGPTGITSDGSNLYVCDAGNATIRKITSAGVVTTFAGAAGSRGTQDGTGTAALFNAPRGIVYSSSSGSLFVTDSTSNTIRMITSAGVVTTFAGSANAVGESDGAAGQARFNHPTGLTIDGYYNLYVADTYNHTIRKITTARRTASVTAEGTIVDAGTATVVVTDPGLTGSPISLSVEVAAEDTAATWAPKVVTALSANTVIAARYTPSSSGAVITLTYLSTVDDDSNIPNVSLTNGTCTGITPTSTSASTGQFGTVVTLAGSAGISGLFDGTAGYALFNLPQGLASDTTGTLYVADTGNSCIRRVNTKGGVITLAGMAGLTGYRDGAGASALFNQPQGVMLTGSVLIVDTGNSVLRALNVNLGTVSTVALKAPASSSTSDDSTSSGGGGAPSLWFIGLLSLLGLCRRQWRAR